MSSRLPRRSRLGEAVSREDEDQGYGCFVILFLVLIGMLFGFGVSCSMKLGDIARSLSAIEKAIAAKEQGK